MNPDYAQLVQDKIALRRAAGLVLDASEDGALIDLRRLRRALERLQQAMDETNDERRRTD